MSHEFFNPQKMREYYTNIPATYPANRDDPHWRKGAEMCVWRHRLQSEQSLQQADIDAFLESYRAEVSRHSVWLALGLEFRRWARERGFYA